jgi:hypothetical protein
MTNRDYTLDMFMHIYILYSYTYTYIFIVLYFIINYEKIAQFVIDGYKITAQRAV